MAITRTRRPRFGLGRARQLRGFKIEHVWDIAQTESEPLPDVAPVLPRGGPLGLWEAVAEQVTAAGMESSADRVAARRRTVRPTTGTSIVTVRADLSPAQSVKTLVHELAHILLGHVDAMSGIACRGRIDVEAESVAYLVCTWAGIEADAYSLPYVARWAMGDVAVVQESGERVITAARSVRGAVEPTAAAA